MKIVLKPVVDTEYVCANCKYEFTIIKEKILENYNRCPQCGCLRKFEKDEKSKNNVGAI